MGLDFRIYKIERKSLPKGYKMIHGTLSDETLSKISNLLTIEDYYSRKPYHLLDYFANNLVTNETMETAFFYYAINKSELNDIHKHISKTCQEYQSYMNDYSWEYNKYLNLGQYLNDIRKKKDNSYIYIFEFDW